MCCCRAWADETICIYGLVGEPYGLMKVPRPVYFHVNPWSGPNSSILLRLLITCSSYLLFCLFLPFLNLWEIMALLVSLVVDINHYCYKVCLFSAAADEDLCASTDQYYKKDPALKIIIANTWRKSQSGEGSSKPKFCCTSNAPLKVFSDLFLLKQCFNSLCLVTVHFWWWA